MVYDAITFIGSINGWQIRAGALLQALVRGDIIIDDAALAAEAKRRGLTDIGAQWDPAINKIVFHTGDLTDNDVRFCRLVAKLVHEGYHYVEQKPNISNDEHILVYQDTTNFISNALVSLKSRTSCQGRSTALIQRCLHVYRMWNDSRIEAAKQGAHL